VGVLESSEVHGATLGPDDAEMMREQKTIVAETARFRAARARLVPALQELLEANEEYRLAYDAMLKAHRSAKTPMREPTIGTVYRSAEDMGIRVLIHSCLAAGIRPESFLR
jgi:hypothetical protein